MHVSDRLYFGAMAALGVVLVLAVIVVWNNISGDDEDEVVPPPSQPTEIRGVLTAPSSTPTAEASVEATASPTAAPPTPEPTATLSPRQIPTPVVTSTPVPLETPPPPTPEATPPTPVPPETVADFSGAWRIVDTVTSGAGAGQQFTFDVVLVQSGTGLQGGGDLITLTGAVQGDTATVQFVQPGLGITGTFVWTMAPGAGAAGSFTSSVPNAGASQLIPLQ